MTLGSWQIGLDHSGITLWAVDPRAEALDVVCFGSLISACEKGRFRGRMSVMLLLPHTCAIWALRLCKSPEGVGFQRPGFLL